MVDNIFLCITKIQSKQDICEDTSREFASHYTKTLLKHESF